jgi:two-component system sensor histidine kinase VicK
MANTKDWIKELKEKLAVTAKEKEAVRRKLVVTAKNLAVVAKEKEGVRQKLAVTAKALAVTAKEKEVVRRKLAVTAKELVVTAREKEDVRRKLVVTAKALAVYTTGLEIKDIKRTAELVERVKELESLNSVLATSRAKERAILLSIGDGLFATDEKGSIIFLNKKAEKSLGRKSEEVMGKVFSEIIIKEDDKGNPVPFDERPINMALLTGVAPIITKSYYYVRKNKTKFPVSITVTPILLEGKIIGAIEVFRDITQEKAVDKAKSEFISVASHQLKTPATAIKLLAERLLSGKMGTFTKRQIEYFDDIHSSNERMIELVNALLRVSRIELGAYVIRVQEKSPTAIVKSILNEFKYGISKKRLKLKIVYPKKDSPLLLDEHMFRMVINNLIANAINYTKEGGEIQVECKTMSKGDILGKKVLDEDSFTVTVSDTGYGIPLVAQDKVFTKFFRADNARQKHTDGTGLGLYIVKSTLNYSGGEIWFTSKENVGSAFYVTIPTTGMRATLPKKHLND